MKTLQTNFTTPEQSKRLLELGVPADSADMRYHQECVRMNYGKEEFEYFLLYGKPDINKYSTDIPCWSVGRLMEIYEICTGETFERNDVYNISSDIFTTIESALLNHKMDFSKMEDYVCVFQ